MNKIEIIERLLDSKQISAKEALVLLEKEKEFIYISQPYYYQQWGLPPVTAPSVTEPLFTYTTSNPLNTATTTN